MKKIWIMCVLLLSLGNASGIYFLQGDSGGAGGVTQEEVNASIEAALEGYDLNTTVDQKVEDSMVWEEGTAGRATFTGNAALTSGGNYQGYVLKNTEELLVWKAGTAPNGDGYVRVQDKDNNNIFLVEKAEIKTNTKLNVRKGLKVIAPTIHTSDLLGAADANGNIAYIDYRKNGYSFRPIVASGSVNLNNVEQPRSYVQRIMRSVSVSALPVAEASSNQTYYQVYVTNTNANDNKKYMTQRLEAIDITGEIRVYQRSRYNGTWNDWVRTSASSLLKTYRHMNTHNYTISQNDNAVKIIESPAYQIDLTNDVKISYQVPYRLKNIKADYIWVGGYVNVNVSINGTWYNLGNKGYDGGMTNGLALNKEVIGTAMGSVILSLADMSGVAGVAEVIVSLEWLNFATDDRQASNINSLHAINADAQDLDKYGAAVDPAKYNNFITVEIEQLASTEISHSSVEGM